tara:strand:- start:408 stop:560 length:153 start_codon:yes stop_codon:yes gene_type:complete
MKVYVLTYTDDYGRQLFNGVYSSRKKALKHLLLIGEEENNINEINKVDVN